MNGTSLKFLGSIDNKYYLYYLQIVSLVDLKRIVKTTSTDGNYLFINENMGHYLIFNILKMLHDDKLQKLLINCGDEIV